MEQVRFVSHFGWSQTFSQTNEYLKKQDPMLNLRDFAASFFDMKFERSVSNGNQREYLGSVGNIASSLASSKKGKKKTIASWLLLCSTKSRSLSTLVSRNISLGHGWEQ